MITKRRGGPLGWGLSLGRSADPTLSFQDYVDLLQSFQWQGVQYTLPGATQEEISGFTGYARSAYKTNGVVFACCLVRMLFFAEARFQFRQIRNGRPGDLFGTEALAPLENPWPGATTGDLLSKMIQYADIAGNAFAVLRPGPRIVPLRPDWVTIVAGTGTEPDDASIWDPDVELLGYVYQPGGPGSGEDPIPYAAEEVAHFAPIPDPEARFRGMSWLTPVIREVMADKGMTDHKIASLENGATPNLVVKLDVPDLDKFKKWIEVFKGEHEGAKNAYKTLFLGAGADATAVGSSFRDLEFKATQGAGETRIAMAAKVHPAIVGLSEGLQGSALNAGNLDVIWRQFANGTMRPLWRNIAGSLARIIRVPQGAELWYDDRDIPALQQDETAAAAKRQTDAATANTLITAGYSPDAVMDAIVADDFKRLIGAHTGLVSVQLLPPGETGSPEQNGKAPAKTQRAVQELLALSTGSKED